MNTNEFEGLVEGSEESPNLEFKGACSWSERTFAKDILAMANLQDGGFIVVGIKDATWEREGLNDTQIQSFDIERMRDQLAEYADSFVNFSLAPVTGKDGKKFIVIRVSEFEEIPVVSRIDKYDVKKGNIYYRSERGRRGSKPVSNSYDMKDIIERATVKLMTRRKSQGYDVPQDSSEESYKEELGDL